MKYFHGRERVVDKDKGTITYVEKYPWKSRDAKCGSAVTHVGVWIVLTGVLAIIIL
jgi:hypothetical protein